MEQKELKERFQKAEAVLIAALNGCAGFENASDDVITECRRRFMQAQKDCKDGGVEVVTVWEFAQKRRKEAIECVRGYAEDQARIKPMFPYARRHRIAWMVAFAVAAVVLLYMWFFPKSSKSSMKISELFESIRSFVPSETVFLARR